MGQKMLYIREEDEPYFAEAQKICGDSFSAVVAQAIKRYVELHQATLEGFSEIQIAVDELDKTTGELVTVYKKFFGKLLVKGEIYYGPPGEQANCANCVHPIEMYQTRKGKVLTWAEYEDIFTTYSIDDDVPSSVGYEILDANGDTAYCGTINIPLKLQLEAKKKLGVDTAEFLDI